jgi:type VI secretion system VasD/TssJ family lipoprotein
MKNKINYLFYSVLMAGLIGCGSGMRTMNVDLHCDDNCNDNNAIVVKIYQLKNAEKFRHASFESLQRNAEEILSDDLIPNSKYEKLMVPNESFQLKNLQIQKDANYLGIVGDFHSPAKDGWLQVIPLNKDFDNLKIMVHENYLTFKTND